MTTTDESKKILKYFSLRRVLIPIVIGLGVAGFLVYRSFDVEVFKEVRWTANTFWCLFLALCLMVVRDLAYIYRIRLLTDKALSWRRSFQVIMLWEFASSVTPSVVGGSAVALYIVNKEGINMGKTTAIVFMTAMLDELFYILMVPIIIIIAGFPNLFIHDASIALFNSKYGTLGIFLLGYLFIVVLTSIIIYGLLINPRGVKWILVRFTRLPFLRKLKHKAADTGDQIIITAREMKGKSIMYWFKAYMATLASWTARYWVVNMIIMAFVSVNDHFLIYARQLVMWVIMLISPTPGSSGVAEVVFSNFLGEFITPGLAPALALLWRIFSFYPYLFIGAIILPGWIRRVYKMK